jgi:predicted transcriptional regulator
MKKELFEKLGFSEGEITLYKAVLKNGEASPAELAKWTGIKRTTCYSMARGLCEKGFLYEDTTKRPKKFTVVVAGEIRSIGEHERKLAKERESLLSQFAEDLSQHVAKNTYPVPAIRFIEEAKIQETLYKRTPVWVESLMKGDQHWWGFQDHAFVDQELEWIRWFWKQVPKEMTLKLLSNESDTDKKLASRYKQRFIKVVPGATDFLSTIWVMGDYVFFLYSRETPMHAVEIKSALMAHDLRTIFKKMWD